MTQETSLDTRLTGKGIECSCKTYGLVATIVPDGQDQYRVDPANDDLIDMTHHFTSMKAAEYYALCILHEQQARGY